MKQIWKGLGAWEKAQCVLMAVLALMGVLLTAVRMWGMRFSGFLLLGAAALLALELWLGRWARRSKAGWWWRLAFRAAAGLVLVPLVLIEGVVIAEGHRQIAQEAPDAVIVLGAGVNGTAPRCPSRPGWTRRFPIWRRIRTSRWCSPAARATGRRSPRRRACTTT